MVLNCRAGQRRDSPPISTLSIESIITAGNIMLQEHFKNVPIDLVVESWDRRLPARA